MARRDGTETSTRHWAAVLERFQMDATARLLTIDSQHKSYRGHGKKRERQRHQRANGETDNAISLRTRSHSSSLSPPGDLDKIYTVLSLLDDCLRCRRGLTDGRAIATALDHSFISYTDLTSISISVSISIIPLPSPSLPSPSSLLATLPSPDLYCPPSSSLHSRGRVHH